MSARKIQPEVEAIFDRYKKNLVRRLKKDDALVMFKTEFSLNDEEAESMFDMFDKDRNGELSLWEFQQFYTCVGQNVRDMLDMFHKLEKDHTGRIDIAKAFDALKTMKTDSGRRLEEEEIEGLLKVTAGKEKAIDLPKFINLLSRLKVHEGQKCPH